MSMHLYRRVRVLYVCCLVGLMPLCRAHHSVQHALGELHLRARLQRVLKLPNEGVRVPPPVPAGIGVAELHIGQGVGVHNDHVVRLRPAVEATVQRVVVADIVEVLRAAVEGHVQSAGHLVRARSGDVDVAGVAQGDRLSRRAGGEELGLAEGVQVGGLGVVGRRGGGQAGVELLQSDTCPVVSAVSDVGRGERGALLAVVEGGDAVLSGEVVLAEDVGGLHEGLVVVLQLAHHVGTYDRVFRPREDKHLVV
mmetsp:Transcript_30074/g.66563  ORF Transcript_30074/g.66563 Transcript_30074/m.66563 type:complete len:252 (-) Transcript_30074:429-1184(-)